MIRVSICLLLAFFITFSGKAQFGKSNIFLFDLVQMDDNSYQLKNPRYLTDFNREGYNNQPHFFSEEQIYITVKFPYQDEPDLYLLDLLRQTKERVTDTPDEGEYSPKKMYDYYRFSAVRKEFDGRDTLQRLWEYPVDRLANGKPIFKYYNKIGYYHWINGNQVALFEVGSPNVLSIADIRTDRKQEIDTEIGRCFKSYGRSLIYLKKPQIGPASIMMVNLTFEGAGKDPIKLTEALDGQEDFAVLPDGTLIMGSGSRIFRYPINDNSGLNKTWEEIVNLDAYGIRNISRLEISPGNQIAIVAD